jgi:hypothetical protein
MGLNVGEIGRHLSSLRDGRNENGDTIQYFDLNEKAGKSLPAMTRVTSHS